MITVAVERPALVSQCAWCNAIKLGGIYYRCPIIAHIAMATHGICNDCAGKVRRGEDTPVMPERRA